MSKQKRIKLDVTKVQKLVILFLISGLVMTALSFFVVRDGQQLYCTPPNPGPLDELSAGHRQERGFPFAYYQDELTTNCWPANAQQMTTDQSMPAITAAVLDLLIWGGVLTTIGIALSSKRKKHHAN